MTAMNGQKLEINDLTNNKGLLSLKIGNARVLDTHSKLLHILNLTSYEENIEAIKTNVENLDKRLSDKKIYLPKIVFLRKKFLKLCQTNLMY